jgi:hypothetical protein
MSLPCRREFSTLFFDGEEFDRVHLALAQYRVMSGVALVNVKRVGAVQEVIGCVQRLISFNGPKFRVLLLALTI